MKRFLTLTVTSAFLLGGALMTGCDLFGPSEGDEDEASVQIGTLNTIAAGTTQDVTGTITSSPAITGSDITITILNASGGDATADFTIVRSNIAESDEIDIQADLGLTITPDATACNGDYTLRITVVAGSAESSDSETFTVSGGDDCTTPNVDTASVVLGAQQAAPGSFLDADPDVMVAYTSGNATNNQASVDAVFGIYSGDPTLMAVDFAAANFTGNVSANWTTQNATRFLPVTAVLDPYETSQADIDALWAAGSGSQVDHLALSQGQVFIIHTVGGVNRLVLVISVQSTTNGTAVLLGFFEV